MNTQEITDPGKDIATHFRGVIERIKHLSPIALLLRVYIFPLLMLPLGYVAGMLYYRGYFSAIGVVGGDTRLSDTVNLTYAFNFLFFRVMIFTYLTVAFGGALAFFINEILSHRQTRNAESNGKSLRLFSYLREHYPHSSKSVGPAVMMVTIPFIIPVLFVTAGSSVKLTQLPDQNFSSCLLEYWLGFEFLTVLSMIAIVAGFVYLFSLYLKPRDSRVPDNQAHDRTFENNCDESNSHSNPEADTSYSKPSVIINGFTLALFPLAFIFLLALYLGTSGSIDLLTGSADKVYAINEQSYLNEDTWVISSNAKHFYFLTVDNRGKSIAWARERSNTRLYIYCTEKTIWKVVNRKEDSCATKYVLKTGNKRFVPPKL